jgi:hypothetical protein
MKHIPKIDLLYWALIISATTMGETAGDLISQTFNLGYGGGTLSNIDTFKQKHSDIRHVLKSNCLNFSSY